MARLQYNSEDEFHLIGHHLSMLQEWKVRACVTFSKNLLSCRARAPSLCCMTEFAPGL